MKNIELLDVYSEGIWTDHWNGLGRSVSHDQIQKLLSNERLSAAELWQMVKPYVRRIRQADGVFIIDNSIAEKPVVRVAVCVYQARMVAQATKLDHFALKTKLYIAALHSAFATLRHFQPIELAA